MMTYQCDNETVYVNEDDSVATITLDGESDVNAVSLEMAKDFRQAINFVEQSNARVGLIRGEGDVYCAGGDLSQTPDEFLDAVEISLDPIIRIFESDRPYIVSIDGAAVGGGLEIALACDLRVAAADATIALPEVALGIIPPAGAIRILSQMVGISRARDLLLTDRELTGAEADNWGIVNRTAEVDEDPDEIAENLARSIATKSQPAIGAVLKSIRETYPRPITPTKWDLELARPLAYSDNFEQGKSAFLSGKQYDFSPE